MRQAAPNTRVVQMKISLLLNFESRLGKKNDSIFLKFENCCIIKKEFSAKFSKYFYEEGFVPKYFNMNLL